MRLLQGAPILLFLIAAPVSGFSPQAESVLEFLRGRIAAGAAGEEAYAVFLDLLAEGESDDCEAWREWPELRSDAMRYEEIRTALDQVCPLQVSPPPQRAQTTQPGQPAQPMREVKRVAKPLDRTVRASIAQTVHPRQDQSPVAPVLQGAGTWSHGAWRLSLKDHRPDARALRVGSDRFALHAGHFQSALSRTRLGFVAGGRFYTDRTGNSGAEGPWFSPRRALDGLGASAQSGGWNLEAAGAWNRLTPMAPSGHAAAVPERRDAVAYLLGLAHSGRDRGGRSESRGAGPDFRFQAAHLRSEPGRETPATLSLAGAELSGVAPGLARWRLGAAGSLPHAAPAPGTAPAFMDRGGYLEAALSAPGQTPQAKRASKGNGGGPDEVPEAPGSWRLEARQASRAWANPLQSPRGILRDTVAGEWIVRGGGEGGISARTEIPVFATRVFIAAVRGGTGADWSQEHGLLRQSGSLGATQTWRACGSDEACARWIYEAGVSLAWTRSGLPGTAVGTEIPGGEARESRNLGQGVQWQRGSWQAKAEFLWKGGGYAGNRPAPFGVEWSRKADKLHSGSWSMALSTDDIRNPGGSLRAVARQVWKSGGKLKVEQEIRLPWTREGMAADMGYQLRLETAL